LSSLLPVVLFTLALPQQAVTPAAPPAAGQSPSNASPQTSTPAPVGPGNVLWATSTEEARQRAARENKFVFLEFVQRECGNCRRMDALLYPAFDFEALLVSMVPVKVDLESPLGKEFARRYDVDQAPAILITTPEGRLVFLAAGFYNQADFFRHANSALEAYRKFARQLDSQNIAKLSAKEAFDTGNELYRRSDPEAALPRLRRAVSAPGATSTQREDSLEILAAVELDLGQPVSSRKTIEQLLTTTKDRARRERAEIFRAQIPLAENRPAEALALFQKFQKDHPTSPHIQRVKELVQRLEERTRTP
jgi:tetratricopeptide (TPR) repeat protein